MEVRQSLTLRRLSSAPLLISVLLLRFRLNLSSRWDSRLKLGARVQAIHYEFRRYARVIRACEDRDPGLADQTERDSTEFRYHSLCD